MKISDFNKEEMAWHSAKIEECKKAGCYFSVRGGIRSIGITDIPNASRDKEYNKAYKLWKSMLQRVFSEKFHKNKPTYIDTKVDIKLTLFSNFYKFVSGLYFAEGYQLDKDLKNDAKTYDANSLIFIPQALNSLFIDRGKARGEYPLFVRKMTIQEAFQCRVSNPFSGKQYTKLFSVSNYENEKAAIDACHFHGIVYKIRIVESYIDYLLDLYPQNTDYSYDMYFDWVLELEAALLFQIEKLKKLLP